MNTNITTATALLATLALTPPAFAQERDPFAPEDPFAANPAENGTGAERSSGIINIRYETFSLDLASAAAMLRSIKSDTALYEHVVELAKTDKAKQESFSILRSRSGQRATCHAITEYIYPTEWDPAEIPNSVGVRLEEPGSDGKAAPDENIPTPFITPATATAFETRYTGITLEVEAVIDADENRIDLRLAPEHVTFTGTTSWGEGVSELEVPGFEAQKLSTGVIAEPGFPRLLGTINRPPASKVDGDSANRIWFAFVTVSQAK